MDLEKDETNEEKVEEKKQSKQQSNYNQEEEKQQIDEKKQNDQQNQKKSEEKEREQSQKDEQVRQSSIHIHVQNWKETNHQPNIQIKESAQIKNSIPSNRQKSPKKVQINQSLNTIQEDEYSFLYSRKQSGKISKMKEKVRQSKPKKKKLFGAKTNEQVEQQVKRWKSQQKQLKRKRQLQKLIRQQRKDQETRRYEEQQRERIEREQQIKKQQIKKRLQLIELRKKERQRGFSENNVRRKNKKQKSPVLYKQKQKQYAEQIQKEEEKIRQIIRKRKQENALKAEEIKAHQREFINRLKNRFSKNSQGDGKKKDGLKDRHRSEFNLFVQHNEEEKKMDLQKYKRRKKFEDKLKKMPVNIDENKRKQALIERDKAQNPLKYNYLLSMGLSQEKIYEQFKEFEININKYELGNNYMRRAHQNIPEQSRLKASKSTPIIETSNRPEYKNYIDEVKVKRKPKKKTVLETQVDQILHKYNNQSERKVQFSKKYSSYEEQVISKIKKLSSIGGYSQSLNQESQIDDLYTKSIKLKIASAQFT